MLLLFNYGVFACVGLSAVWNWPCRCATGPICRFQCWFLRGTGIVCLHRSRPGKVVTEFGKSVFDENLTVGGSSDADHQYIQAQNVLIVSLP